MWGWVLLVLLLAASRRPMNGHPPGGGPWRGHVQGWPAQMELVVLP